MTAFAEGVLHPEDDATSFSLSFGRDVEDNQCRVEQCGPREHSELAAVLGLPRPGTAPWATLSTFSTGLRRADDWSYADGALLDFDWIDPALPAGDGHLPVPKAVAERLTRAAKAGNLPSGIMYPTRRGFRFGVLFRTRVTEAELYGQAVSELGRIVIDALDDENISIARSGTPGFTLDEASCRVAQVQRLPTKGAEVVVIGGKLHDAVALARGESRPSLPLDALPSDIAAAAEAIGAWVQIAFEVVVVHILAIASALIGNTRYVTARGLRHNLSLQFLTLVKSGSGKTTVRKYLEAAYEFVRLEISTRRRQAERDWEKYGLELDAWKSGQKGKKRPGWVPGPRPEAPSSRLRETILLTEATTEALFKALADSPRGFLWSTSEAHEVLGVLGRYSPGGKGRDLDTARIRKLTEGEDTEIHRAGSGISEIIRPFLSIDMDAQPGIVDTLFEAVDTVSGFTARFFVHEPTSMSAHRNYIQPPPEPDPAILACLGTTFAGLWAGHLKLDSHGRPDPEPIRLDAEAEQLWAAEMQRLEDRLLRVSPDEESFSGHLRGRLLRLAAVLRLWEDNNAGFVDAVAMRRAVLIGRYFLSHLRLAGRVARDAEQARQTDAVREWATARLETGKTVSVRDAGSQWNRYRGAKGTALAVAHLRAAGLVPEKQPKSTGPGRPPSDHWVFPNAPAKPAKPPPTDPPPNFAGFDGQVPGQDRNGGGDWDARFAAFNHALSPQVDLPPGGKGTCPFCSHDDCFGRVKDTLAWKCFSADHAAATGGLPDYGDILDLWFFQSEERLPTKDERVQRLLGFEKGEAA